MTPTGEQLVEEYLRRFDNAAVFLKEGRRAELRQEIVEHIEAGIAEAETADADAVRTVLDRLGPPADIVAAETGSGTTGSTPVIGDGPPTAGADSGGTGPRDGGPAPWRGRLRRVPLLVVAAAVTAVVAATVALATSTSGGESAPAPEERPVPTESTTGSESATPTETESESGSATPTESESSPPPTSSSPAATPSSSSASPYETTEEPTPTPTDTAR